MKKIIIIGIVLVIVIIAITNTISFNSQSKSQQEAAKPASEGAKVITDPTATPIPTYLTPTQVTNGLGTFFTLKKLGTVGDGIAWEGVNDTTGTRVRIITDSNIQDKVTTVFVWAKASATDEAKNRVSFSILKTIAANTSPDSVTWLQDAYTTVVKDPTQEENKTFGNKDITINFADVTNQLTFREDVK